jgi:hypothetical protein
VVSEGPSPMRLSRIRGRVAGGHCGAYLHLAKPTGRHLPTSGPHPWLLGLAGLKQAAEGGGNYVYLGDVGGWSFCYHRF